ncbi:MAG: hypothetical protein ACK5UC_12705, partial [Planctomycetaceae bacterium]
MGGSEKSEKLAIHCADGKRPPDWPAKANRQIERLVIGAWEQSESDRKRYKTQPVDADLLQDWQTRLPGLKAVHLWNLTGVTQLPELPAGLHTLEVRNCPDLTALPPLPASLEVLDVSGCGGLKKLTPKTTTEVPPLKQVFFEDVGGLSDLEIGSFIKRLIDDDSNQLVELRVTNHPRLTDSLVQSLVEDPRPNPVSQTLIKLVLRGNPLLTQMGDLSRFEKLRHLDLSNCANLEQIANLPDNLQYFAVWGTKSLSFGPTGTKTQQAQQVPKYDLGTKEQPNVAGRFKTRKKFGGDLTLGAHAKILFLGDGRAGKSNLALSLRQHFSRAGGEVPKDPPESIDSTEGVQLGRWQTHVVVPEQRREQLREMGTDHDWKTEWQDENQGWLNANLQLWDFGGQEIYHQTHRAFVGVGTLYVLVYRPEEMTQEELQADYARQLKLKVQKHGAWRFQEDEWLDQNRQHPLDYWIKYLESLGGPGQSFDMQRDVFLVCAQPPQPPATVGGPERPSPDPSRRVKDPALLAKIPKQHRFCFDSRHPEDDRSGEYAAFVEAVRHRSGEIASQLSLVQPRIYETAVQHVQQSLENNQTDRQ